MKILISGTWHKSRARLIAKEAREVGRLLAENGHTLVSGAGEGTSAVVVDAYRKYGGKRYIAYLPAIKEMKKVGENIGPQPDEIIETNVDYPERNMIMARGCDGAIAIHGRLGALTEIIHVANDYDKPASVIDKGELGGWIKMIPKLAKKVLVTSDPEEAIKHLEK